MLDRNNPVVPITPVHAPVLLCLDACIPTPSVGDVPFQEDTSTLLWSVRPSWKVSTAESLSNVVQSVPSQVMLPPSTVLAIAQSIEASFSPSEDHSFELYIDGSTGPAHAGWAVVVVAKTGHPPDESHRLVGVTGGTVALSPQDHQWVGATRPDNIAAELTALLAAQAIVLQHASTTEFCIRPDLSLSRLLSQQTHTTTAHPLLAQLCTLLAIWNQPRSSYLEVRGHTMNPWNDLADSIAKFCAYPDNAQLFSFDFADIHTLALEPHDVAWDWTAFESSQFQACMPPRFDRTVIQLPAFDPPQLRCTTQDVDDAQHSMLQLRIASINVLALEHTQQHNEIGRRQGSRTARIDLQFHEAGMHVVGVQEARTATGKFQSEHYHIFASGGHGPASAQLGCELWLHKFLPFAKGPDDTPLKLCDGRVAVQHADPRRLLVRVDFDYCSILFVVLHAPCLQKSQGDGILPIDKIQQWWASTSHMMHAAEPTTFIWVCVDANAGLATQSTQFFGLHGADRTGPQTECFEAFLQDTSLYVPSTFAHLHHGPNATWSHSSGAKYRIDYVLANLAAFQLTQKSYTMPDYDGTFTHDDHIPVAVDAKGWTSLACNQSHIRWDEDAMLMPDRCMAFQQALATLPLPTWNVHPNDHSVIYESQLLALARQFFEKKHAKRTRPQLSPNTQQSIAMKRHVLDCGRAMGLMHDPEFKIELKALELHVRRLVHADLTVIFDQLLVHMQEAGQLGDFKAMYAAVTRLGGKRHKRATPNRPIPMLKKPDGTPAQSFTEQQHMWLEQFSAIEAGVMVSPDQVREVSTHGPMPTDTQQTACFPTAWQIQASVSKLKRGKTPGPNRLTPSILKAAGPVFAKQFALLTTKAASHATEPFAWRGGRLVPLHKGKGPPDNPLSYRSIFISNYTGKLYHRAIRTQLEAVWEAKISALQLGSRKGLGTDLAHHLLEAHQAACHVHRTPTAVVFFDMRSAFYSVLRQSLVHLPQDPTALIHALRRLGVSQDEIRTWLAATGDDNATEGASPHLQHLVRDTMSHTYFQVNHLSHLCCTTRGTRPGDPLGDLLFNMIMRLVMEDCRKWFIQHTHCQWMGSPLHTSSFSDACEMPPTGFLDLAYVDDAALALHAPTLDELVHLIQHAAMAMHHATSRRGMTLNFDKGKTEVLWAIAGKGSTRTKQNIAAQGGFLHWHGLNQEFRLSVTQSYRHLGTWMQAPPRCARDIYARASLAKSAWGSLAKPMYSKPYVSMATKGKAFQALSISRLTYNVHTWCAASAADWAKWQNHMRKPMGLMVKHMLMGTPPTHVDTLDLFGIADILAPCDQVHVARLRYFRRLLQYCPTALWTCLVAAKDAQTSWLAACSGSFAWFRQFYHRPFGPSESESVLDWIPYVAMDTRWKGRVRAATRACKRFRQAVAEHHLWQKRFDRAFLAGGGILPQSESLQHETWACDQCPKTFASKKALATHSGRVHGYRRIVKFYAVDDLCNACGKKYHSRQRLVEHLKFVPSCLSVLQACFPALDDATVQELDQLDHAHTLNMRQQGWWATKALEPVSRLQGPLLPPADSQDASQMKQRWTARQPRVGTAYENLQGRRTDAPPETPQVILFEADLPAFVFQSAAGPNNGGGRYAARSLASEYARLHIKTLVFVHVFSGYRRHGDLHQMLEHQVWEHTHFFVISIDMCLQKIEGNLASSKAFQFWMHQIAIGQICGMGGGPPCETFTAARLLEGGPPPLRSGTWPLGFPHLKHKQWQQCIVGSRLIRFLLEALVHLAMHGGAGFLEHPQFPLWAARKDPSSIWSSREVRLLRTLECVGITSFDQCTLGSVAVKPTTILHVRLPKFRQIALEGGHGGRCSHGPCAHERMAGRDEGGEFRTARAKIYPPGLNHALARAINSFVRSTFDGMDTSPMLPEDFSKFAVADFMPEGIVQPDYHG